MGITHLGSDPRLCLGMGRRGRKRAGEREPRLCCKSQATGQTPEVALWRHTATHIQWMPQPSAHTYIPQYPYPVSPIHGGMVPPFPVSRCVHMDANTSVLGLEGRVSSSNHT